MVKSIVGVGFRFSKSDIHGPEGFTYLFRELARKSGYSPNRLWEHWIDEKLWNVFPIQRGELLDEQNLLYLELLEFIDSDKSVNILREITVERITEFQAEAALLTTELGLQRNVDMYNILDFGAQNSLEE
jgi:hypothetical protein